jgi:Hypothetical protein (DUF2513)
MSNPSVLTLISRERERIEMKRDMELTRALLLKMEADPLLDGNSWITFDPQELLQKHSIEEVNYHIRLLIESGFVEGNIGPVYPTISKLTWAGHDFAASVKDKEIWAKTKERIKDLQTATLGIVFEIAKAEAKKRLGLP